MGESIEIIKSVRFSAKLEAKVGHIARKLGHSKREVVVQMVDYFYASKIDPADLSDELLKRELSSALNRIPSFIRQQETDSLVAIVSGQQEIGRSASSIGLIAKGLIKQQEVLIETIK